MTKRILIKPQNDLIVSNPFTKLKVKPEGEEVLEHTHWRRLEANGDISITELSEKKTARSAKE